MPPMSLATFDTLKFAKTLRAAGVPAEQAEAQAQAFADVVQVNLSGLATREDVAAVRAELDRAVKELRAEIDRAVKELRAEIDRTAKQAKTDLDQAVKELRAEIRDESSRLRLELAGVTGRLDTVQAKLGGDMLLLKWMFGAVIGTSLTMIGLLLRLSFKP